MICNIVGSNADTVGHVCNNQTSCLWVCPRVETGRHNCCYKCDITNFDCMQIGKRRVKDDFILFLMRRKYRKDLTSVV